MHNLHLITTSTTRPCTNILFPGQLKRRVKSITTKQFTNLNWRGCTSALVASTVFVLFLISRIRSCRRSSLVEGHICLCWLFHTQQHYYPTIHQFKLARMYQCSRCLTILQKIISRGGTSLFVLVISHSTALLPNNSPI